MSITLPTKKQILSFVLLASLVFLALSPSPLAASALTLAWDSNTEDDLAGYRVYCGTEPQDYDVVIDVGKVTQYTVTGLEPETEYYLAVTAYDVWWNESDLSEEVSGVTHPLNLVIAGLGETSLGYMEAFAPDYRHGHWLRVDWWNYDSANGEARLATGDIDGDGKDEIVIGLAPVSGDPSVPGGYFQILDDDYAHLFWGRISWVAYDSANGESWPACGDLDGDGKDEIIIGLGSYPADGGWLEVFNYDAGTVSHKAWIRVTWDLYNSQSGETRPACGDIDGDGKDEIVVGLGPVPGDPSLPGGWFQVLDDDFTDLGRGRIHLAGYNNANGESWPACGDVDGDGDDEIIIGLGPGGGGNFEVHDYLEGLLTYRSSGTVNWIDYNIDKGETRPACGDIDGDGKDEIIVGLGRGSGGWMEIFDDASTGYVHLGWAPVQWKEYCIANGETWPAVKK
jgi:hypothetical protein